VTLKNMDSADAGSGAVIGTHSFLFSFIAFCKCNVNVNTNIATSLLGGGM